MFAKGSVLVMSRLKTSQDCKKSLIQYMRSAKRMFNPASLQPAGNPIDWDAAASIVLPAWSCLLHGHR